MQRVYMSTLSQDVIKNVFQGAKYHMWKNHVLPIGVIKLKLNEHCDTAKNDECKSGYCFGKSYEKRFWRPWYDNNMVWLL